MSTSLNNFCLAITNTPNVLPTGNPFSVVTMQTSDRGLLPPRLSTAERTALGAAFTPGVAEKGMFVYDTDLQLYHYWNSSVPAWIPLATGGTAAAEWSVFLVCPPSANPLAAPQDFNDGLHPPIYNTIQAAVTAAAASYVAASGVYPLVLVRPGTYTENVTFLPNVVVRGAVVDRQSPFGKQSPVKVKPANVALPTAVFDSYAVDDMSSVQGLTFENDASGTGVAVQITNACRGTVALTDCYVESLVAGIIAIEVGVLNADIATELRFYATNSTFVGIPNGVFVSKGTDIKFDRCLFRCRVNDALNQGAAALVSAAITFVDCKFSNVDDFSSAQNNNNIQGFSVLRCSFETATFILLVQSAYTIGYIFKDCLFQGNTQLQTRSSPSNTTPMLVQNCVFENLSNLDWSIDEAVVSTNFEHCCITAVQPVWRFGLDSANNPNKFVNFSHCSLAFGDIGDPAYGLRYYNTSSVFHNCKVTARLTGGDQRLIKFDQSNGDPTILNLSIENTTIIVGQEALVETNFILMLNDSGQNNAMNATVNILNSTLQGGSVDIFTPYAPFSAEVVMPTVIIKQSNIILPTVTNAFPVPHNLRMQFRFICLFLVMDSTTINCQISCDQSIITNLAGVKQRFEITNCNLSGSLRMVTPIYWTFNQDGEDIQSIPSRISNCLIGGYNEDQGNCFYIQGVEGEFFLLDLSHCRIQGRRADHLCHFRLPSNMPDNGILTIHNNSFYFNGDGTQRSFIFLEGTGSDMRIWAIHNAFFNNKNFQVGWLRNDTTGPGSVIGQFNAGLCSPPFTTVGVVDPYQYPQQLYAFANNPSYGMGEKE